MTMILDMTIQACFMHTNTTLSQFIYLHSLWNCISMLYYRTLWRSVFNKHETSLHVLCSTHTIHTFNCICNCIFNFALIDNCYISNRSSHHRYTHLLSHTHDILKSNSTTHKNIIIIIIIIIIIVGGGTIINLRIYFHFW